MYLHIILDFKMIKYIASGIFLYLFIGSVLYFSQRRLTFNVSGTPNKPEYYGLSNNIETYIKISKSINLISWFIKPKKNMPIIVYFHGNSFDIGERAYRIKNYINKGFGILLPAYRGYSGNKGKPNEKKLYEDSKIIIKWLKDKHSFSDKDIVIYGESLGTAVAVELSQKKDYKCIILEAPFTSIGDVAQKLYPLYPVKFLIWDKFDNLNKINNLVSPTLFIHGKKDEIVPFEMGKKLYEIYKGKKLNLFVDEAKHNDLYEYGIASDVIKFIKNN